MSVARRVRSALTGRFVTPREADSNPGGTVRERANRGAGTVLVSAVDSLILGAGFDQGGRTEVNTADLERLKELLP